MPSTAGFRPAGAPLRLAAALLVAAAWLIAPIGCRAGDVREKPGAGMVGGDDRAAEWTIPARD
ncbi:MAG TPA: hypothetical protein VGD77_12115, partial [Gemmatimonadaceae bacterium]